MLRLRLYPFDLLATEVTSISDSDHVAKYLSNSRAHKQVSNKRFLREFTWRLGPVQGGEQRGPCCVRQFHAAEGGIFCELEKDPTFFTTRCRIFDSVGKAAEQAKA